MKKKLFKLLFIVFLISYFIFLLNHAINEISIWLFLGIGVSVLSHAKKNLLTLMFLLGHMSIEWFEWGAETFILSLVLLNIVHTIMDFIFLNHEIKVHIKKINSYFVLFIVLIFLISLYISSPNIKIDEEVLEILHRFVLGGVIGCVGTHSIFHLTKEK
jgi:hypothetical protein